MTGKHFLVPQLAASHLPPVTPEEDIQVEHTHWGGVVLLYTPIFTFLFYGQPQIHICRKHGQ